LPNADQTASVTEMLRQRSALPKQVSRVLSAMPPNTHPMTQFAQAILSLQPGSHFAKAYEAGVHKSKLWDPFFEDSMDLIAKLPAVAALIYRSALHLFF
jgi:citrate synthase